jgi:alkylation response protein AidB-like acyl-CoA dehydrogenase
MVENCKITFNNVQLDKEAWMPDAKSFKKGVESMLKLSRIQVLFIAAGACIGVYRHLIKYTQDRKQFGKNIAAFQMMQLKVYEVMANLQGILMMCWRATELASTGGLTLGHVGMFKAWITERSRHIAKIGREALGGNGITHDRYIMKALCDIEALYTY